MKNVKTAGNNQDLIGVFVGTKYNNIQPVSALNNLVISQENKTGPFT
jgi:hypothetical protein